MKKQSNPSVTLFSFGYYGWGSSTEELVKGADAVERSRGFKPPIFVDIRHNRQVRAKGFNGNAFGDLLGGKRYLWMKRLGNKNIKSKGKSRMALEDPKAVTDLLDLALEAKRDNRRVIYFCGCEFPMYAGKIRCHRTLVTRILIREARKRDLDLSVVEWPGDEPRIWIKDVSPEMFDSVAKGRATLPLDWQRVSHMLSGLPFGSILTLKSRGRELHRLACPGMYKSGTWTIPFLYWYFDPDIPFRKYEEESEKMRMKFGLNEYRS